MNRMMFKRIAPIALSALLLGTAAAYAEQPATNERVQQMQEPAFSYQTGKVTAAENFGDGTLYVADEGDNIFHFYVDDKTLVYDNTGQQVTVEIGDQISLALYTNQPMIMIYPPRYTPAVVIVETDKPGMAFVEQFDENNVNVQGDLVVRVSDKTVIVNGQGDVVKASELPNYSALFFVQMIAESYPAQAFPDKIIVFPKLEDLYTETLPIAPQIAKIIGDDVKELDGQLMVPLRKVAQGLGYNVTSTGKGAIVSKGARSYTITRGELVYGYNKALRYFDVAPELLEKNKTYVEYNFALELLQ